MTIEIIAVPKPGHGSSIFGCLKTYEIMAFKRKLSPFPNFLLIRMFFLGKVCFLRDTFVVGMFYI